MLVPRFCDDKLLLTVSVVEFDVNSAFVLGYDLTRQLSWAKFSNFTPSDVQLAVRFQSTESIDAADATFSGNGSLGVCADWADATAPFHCVYERKEYNTFAALSLTASVVTAFIPVMVLIIKVATPVRD